MTDRQIIEQQRRLADMCERSVILGKRVQEQEADLSALRERLKRADELLRNAVSAMLSATAPDLYWVDERRYACRYCGHVATLFEPDDGHADSYCWKRKEALLKEIHLA